MHYSTDLRISIRYAGIVLGDQPGVFESHLDNDWILRPIGKTNLGAFCEEWVDTALDKDFYPRDDFYRLPSMGQYLGVVHADGCYLVRLQCKRAEASK